MKPKVTQSIDEYISTFPEDVQPLLRQLRVTIKSAAPQATETISWQMPSFKLNGYLVHFAAYKNHIGFYPGTSAIDAFKEKLAVYKTSKGAIQFPLDKPLPLDLVTQIVHFRVKEQCS